MDLVTSLCLVCWAINFVQWIIRQVLKEWYSARYDKDDGVNAAQRSARVEGEIDHKNTANVTLSYRCCVTVDTEIICKWLKKLESRVNDLNDKITATENLKQETEINSFKINQLEGLICDLSEKLTATENSKMDTETTHLWVDQLDERIDDLSDSIKAIKNSKLKTETNRLRINQLDGHLNDLKDKITATGNLKLEMETNSLKINQLECRVMELCDDNMEAAGNFTAENVMTHLEALNKRIDLLNECAKKYETLENRMDAFKNESVNVTCIQALNKRIDLIQEYATISTDRVTCLVNKYRTLENRMDTFKCDSAIVAGMQALNKNIDLIQEYCTMSTDMVTYLANKCKTLESRVEAFENNDASPPVFSPTLSVKLNDDYIGVPLPACIESLNNETRRFKDKYMRRNTRVQARRKL